ncbi:MAG: hypothetical protein AAGA05_00925 [Pseudomonadota bacterium]
MELAKPLPVSLQKRCHGWKSTSYTDNEAWYRRLVTGGQRPRALEKQAVLASLENLMIFPFVKSAVCEGVLSLNGLWTGIGEEGLECFDPTMGRFLPV